ncbi:MAG: L-lactate permease [Egibacteraceae bacterium]
MDAPAWVSLVAAAPLAALAVLVLSMRVGLGVSAWAVVAGTATLAGTLFGLRPGPLLYAAAKGAWTGVWILLIAVPALLLFQVAESSGALDAMSGALQTVAPTPGRLLLLAAWVFPSFIQGVAGFGVPVVIAAPMLVRAGMQPVAAVVACFVGYHWSVTFGSMGSSFFVAAGAAQLDAGATGVFALRAAGLLAVHAVVAGLLLLVGYARSELRQTLSRALLIGAVMGATLVGVALVQPALASTAAGLAGLGTAALLLPERGTRPAWGMLIRTTAPYLLLTVLVVVAFGIPPVRALAAKVPPLAPSFPLTSAAFGHVNAAVTQHQPFKPLLHPGPYLLVAAGAGALFYRRLGGSVRGARAAEILHEWLGQSRTTATSLLALTVLAGIMVDAGMVEALAEILARGLGPAYPALAPMVGAAGTVMTNSTTAANALLAPLQASAAGRLGLPEATLLAAQTVGASVGKILAPVDALVAVTAAGSPGDTGAVLRAGLLPTLLLLLLASAATWLLTT